MATLVLGTICFVLTKVTGEYSWVDRIWPVLPIAYGLHFLYHQQNCRGIEISTRQFVMIFLTTLWGMRLQYNFFRKGGFKAGGEDYRWAYIRENYHWILVELLNFFFTAYYQLILILWFSSPIFNAHEGSFSIADGVCTALWILFFAGEVTADEQQWAFQNEKHRLLRESGKKLGDLPERYRKGFLTEGLFRYSRHPNFFCEISIWWVQFLFSASSVGLNYTGLGALLLNLLFLGSTALTEKISSEKYPLYTEYQKTTSKLIPLPSGEPTKAESKKD